MPKPRVICLTPVRNEAWILERFLRCAGLWADEIVILDQRSDDGSVAIARRFPKVRLIANDCDRFDEAVRWSRLLHEARRFAGPRLLIALDADEILAAGAWTTAEWAAMLAARPGTGFRLPMWNLRPGLTACWQEPVEGLWGFMDDGRPYHGDRLHSRRLPLPAASDVVDLPATAVLHYQFTDWERMRAKHRWYLCLERILRPERPPLEIYRQYHHMDAVPRARLRPVRPEWLAGYEETGIDMRCRGGGPPYWFEHEVVSMIDRHGADHFRRLAIWHTDWAALAARLGHHRRERFRDPRSWRERAVHGWLRLTQPASHRRLVRWLDAQLQRRGW